MSKLSLWNRKDGSVYINNGPINPVIDKDAAHSMAIASNQVLIDHDRGLELANGGDPLNLANRKLGRRALMNAQEIAKEQNRVEEQVRSHIGGNDIERAKVLFNLVELKPPEYQ